MTVALATAPPPGSTLTAGERAHSRALATGRRRRDWLLGRAALKALLPPGEDTSALVFPHPRLSLTHAGGAAFALHAPAGVAGAGIDFELRGRPVDARTARLFLRPAERHVASTGAGLLRLWTVKEALFKATPANEEAVLVDYELHDAASRRGEATGPRGELFRYATLDVHGGLLSVAVCLRVEGCRAAV